MATKAEKAAELRRLAAKGPDIGWFHSELPSAERKYAEAYAKEAYQRWSETWLLPLIDDLLPAA